MWLVGPLRGLRPVYPSHLSWVLGSGEQALGGAEVSNLAGRSLGIGESVVKQRNKGFAES